MKVLMRLLRFLHGRGGEPKSSYYMDHNMKWRRDGGIPAYVKRHIMATRGLRKSNGDQHEM